MSTPFDRTTIKTIPAKKWGAEVDYANPDVWVLPDGRVLKKSDGTLPKIINALRYCLHYWGPTATGAGQKLDDTDRPWTWKQKTNYYLGRTYANCRSGERWHIYGRRMRGGAYTAVITPWLARLVLWRGWRHNGGLTGNYLNSTTVSIAIPIGGKQRFRRRARRTFARLWVEHPLPVFHHSQLSWSHSKCAGEHKGSIGKWVESEGWIKDLGVFRKRYGVPGPRNGRVLSLSKRLTDLHHFDRRTSYYGRPMRRAVTDYQRSTRGRLKVDGVCGPDTWRKLAEETTWT